jgi:hypothetical protein
LINAIALTGPTAQRGWFSPSPADRVRPTRERSRRTKAASRHGPHPTHARWQRLRNRGGRCCPPRPCLSGNRRVPAFNSSGPARGFGNDLKATRGGVGRARVGHNSVVVKACDKMNGKQGRAEKRNAFRLLAHAAIVSSPVIAPSQGCKSPEETRPAPVGGGMRSASPPYAAGVSRLHGDGALTSGICEIETIILGEGWYGTRNAQRGGGFSDR